MYLQVLHISKKINYSCLKVANLATPNPLNLFFLMSKWIKLMDPQWEVQSPALPWSLEFVILRKFEHDIGDSMVKKTDGYLLTSSINHRYIVKVRPFLSAKTIDMVDYIKPTQRDFNPDVYLLHVGTNDLSSNKSPEQISLDILNLANSLKLDNNTVIVSSIVPRDDEN